MQDKYTVKVTDDAMKQLEGLSDYIGLVLKEPGTAKKMLATLWKEIGSLDAMPQRIALVYREPWRSKGVRRMLVKNYFVYFWIDEAKAKVQVTAVVCAQSDQERVLRQMRLDESYSY